MPKTSNIYIISGQFKGAKIHSPHSATTHPMGSRERLALFNMVDVRDLKVLDLYAGSGALGLEALSRGAAEVEFVDNSAPAVSTIKSNLQRLNLSTARVTRAKVHNFLHESEKTFDIIFADPPYDQFIPADLEKAASSLAPSGTFVLSSPARLPEVSLPNLEIISSRTYAAARLTIYRKID